MSSLPEVTGLIGPLERPAGTLATRGWSLRRALRRAGPAALLPLLGIALWQAIVMVAQPADWLLPGPAAVAEALWRDHDRLWFHAQATIAASLIGLALAIVAGIALALAISGSRAADRAVYPWIVASQTVPILAVAPLLGIWVGYGTAQVLVAAIFCFFPVVVTGVDGLRAADPALAGAVRTLGASRAWVWRNVTLPAALPALFPGLKMAAVFAVTGAVVAEYLGADRGLGFLSEVATGQFETVLVFAAIAWLALIGIVLFALISALERLAMPHRHRSVARRRSPR